MIEEAIERIKIEFEQVEQDLQDPDIVSDIKKLSEISVKRARLKNILEINDNVRKFLEDIEEYKEMMKDPDIDTEFRESLAEELKEIVEKLPELQQKLKYSLIPPDPKDAKDAIVEVRAGTGGDEAAIFAGDIYRMYVRYCEKNNFTCKLISVTPSESGGYREISMAISGGENPYGNFKYEAGVHRVQRVPQTESQGRVHTSAISVAVIPEADDVDIKVEEKDIRVDTYRASGAGGQHVNKTDSAVRMTHIPTGVVAACQDERSQIQNRARALQVLKAKIHEKMVREQEIKYADAVKTMVGSGDRSDKIRTYNYPQNRMTDHRINLTIYNLDGIMEGDINKIIDALRTTDYDEFLKNL